MTRSLALLAVLVWAAGPVQGGSDAFDLGRCFELAKKQSEGLRLQAEQVEQLEQQYRQALAGVLPALGFNASQFYQDTGGGGGASSITATSKPQVSFSLSQPLFSGFREYAAMRSFRHEGKRARLLLQHADRQLFRDVTNAFYLVLGLEKDLEDLSTLEKLTQDRAKELREREQLGKSRLSEVLSVESQLAGLRSQSQGVKGQIAAARELLSFLIGQDAAGLTLTEAQPDPADPGPGDAYIAKASARSDVRAASEEYAARQDLLKAAWGAWYPTAAMTGGYYLKRVASLEPIRWDVTFALSVPVFSGGTTMASVRLAESQLRAATEGAGLALRQARAEIKTAHLALQSAVAQVQSLKEAHEKAAASYQLQVKEYRLGIVNNLTVLQALNDMINAERALDQTALQARADVVRLKVATEELP